MSYNGISALIILVTSLVAFYLLYRAKELNLGILISISAGSVILGFTFFPVFKAVMILLKDSIFIHKGLAFIISVLTVLVVFLTLILIISFIVSVVIPDRLASVDCGAVIDTAMAKIKFGSADNMLKKPVDTKQKIDTMGIEKSEEASENSALHNVSEDASAENSEDAVHNSTLYIEQAMGEKACGCGSFEESDSNMCEFNEEINDFKDKCVMGEQLAAAETEVQVAEIPDNINIPESEPQIPAPEAEQNKASAAMEDAKSLVFKALQKKGDNRKEEAIVYYMKALQLQPDSEMLLWIVLDVCALYKQLGLNELAISILEAVACQNGTAIKPEVKKEIMNCLV
ncbi:hypothetical protein LY28_02187 [Ruminiclostridium sufflavum DSM 19573]|uniref:Tetratricopeptide repeat protein n=1 Tax=Ruminiclostridium sufflavum DSM 19573 TaxID=1121337 RepID=A0A318XWU7_9FIRM|nr:hypothetical protein [Ruminiclostridium sufflavum]PYG87282.1 hypothetical protein LY28_02187 [Ruminiclostridium sufflavum DSM 19573]